MLWLALFSYFHLSNTMSDVSFRVDSRAYSAGATSAATKTDIVCNGFMPIIHFLENVNAENNFAAHNFIDYDMHFFMDIGQVCENHQCAVQICGYQSRYNIVMNISNLATGTSDSRNIDFDVASTCGFPFGFTPLWSCRESTPCCGFNMVADQVSDFSVHHKEPWVNFGSHHHPHVSPKKWNKLMHAIHGIRHRRPSTLTVV